MCSTEAGSLNGFLAKVEQQLGRPIARVDAKHIRPRPAQDRQAHIGAHPQKQPGLFYLGVVLPVGKMSCAQIRAFAVIARDLGDGDIRLTVWQNLLISGISEGRLQRAKAAVEEAGLEGQQDCGQCGYNCEDYANAIAAQAEDRLNLCVPGAKETARMLKTLVEEMGGGATDPDEAKAKADAKTAAKALDADIRPGSSRNAPAEAVFAGRKRFNREGSEKATYHVEFDISDAGLDYEPGDSFGIFPENDESLVDQVIAAIGAPHDFPTDGKILHQVLREDVSLGLAPDMLFELISYIIGGFSMAKAKALAKGKESRRRRRDARCAGGRRKIREAAARSRGFRRGPGTAAAEALFNRLVVQGGTGARIAHHRPCALCDRRARAAWRCLDVRRHGFTARRQGQGLYPAGA